MSEPLGVCWLEDQEPHTRCRECIDWHSLNETELAPPIIQPQSSPAPSPSPEQS